MGNLLTSLPYTIACFGISVLSLYFVIRIGVRHAIEDAELKRQHRGDQ